MQKPHKVLYFVLLLILLVVNASLIAFKYYLYLIVGVPAFLIMFYFLVREFKIFANEKSIYEFSLKKIKKSYDAILSNVKEIPDLEGINVITITNLLDFIDAQAELRKPIIYVENRNSADFLIIDDKEAVVFSLKMNNDSKTPLETKVEALAKKESVEDVIDNLDKTQVIKVKNKSYKVSPMDRDTEDDEQIIIPKKKKDIR